VLKGIIKQQKNALFGCVLKENWRYWPANIPGDAMQTFFNREGVNVGNRHAISTGMMDGMVCNLWGMKEPNYAMRTMATSGPLAGRHTCKEAAGEIKAVCWHTYACLFDWHFHYCHAVNNHNNLCHKLPLIKNSWCTMQLETCMFLFIWLSLR
jgi:hypothetical protein